MGFHLLIIVAGEKNTVASCFSSRGQPYIIHWNAFQIAIPGQHLPSSLTPAPFVLPLTLNIGATSSLVKVVFGLGLQAAAQWPATWWRQQECMSVGLCVGDSLASLMYFSSELHESLKMCVWTPLFVATCSTSKSTKSFSMNIIYIVASPSRVPELKEMCNQCCGMHSSDYQIRIVTPASGRG